MGPYPNAYQIEEIFATRTQPEKFHEYMADPVDVEVVGEDHEIAGHYKSLEEFNEKVFARISDTVKRESIRLEIKRVIGGGESAWAAVEYSSTAESKYGKDRWHTLKLVDLVRFDSNGKIATIREYFDTRLIHDLVLEHEANQGKEEEQTEG
ncbi:uncharacterized protein KY384_004465 [Bacidia gigantensis]|uniref:uncharacterized protein n=1 Tax=Bacidia gigantensis TaxID=2732470 RepID=UPI001D0535A1|nr:uncharacterized protein KY384_004465 [Bacidia gigantensis]KAG8531108.1 hypothetical protein KY384_004465 [Bacidia gigantensis]